MSRYLPLCDYMSQKTGLPQPLVSKFNICGSLVAANTLCYLTAPQFSQTSSLSLAVANLTACGLTASAEGFVPKLLNKQRIGLTKGGMILRSSQIGAFFNALSPFDWIKSGATFGKQNRSPQTRRAGTYNIA